MMNEIWSSDLTEIDWNELCELFEAAPLGTRDPVKLEETFRNSKYRSFLFVDSKLVGVGRALADGHDCSYVCDIAVHPDYQGKGFGKKIVRKLIDQSSGHEKIILYANPGKEGFYSKLGFMKMNTAMAIFQNEEAMMQNGTISVWKPKIS
jgi:ribosomal protein S18 acetylase RimI-like enzyme